MHGYVTACDACRPRPQAELARLVQLEEDREKIRSAGAAVSLTGVGLAKECNKLGRPEQVPPAVTYRYCSAACGCHCGTGAC